VNLQKFQIALAEAWNPILAKMLKTGALQVQLALKAHGGDVEWPLVLQKGLRREEQYIERLNILTKEIVDSYDSMRAAETYLGRFPFLRQGITASSYIRFHLESYFHEGYILSERMRVFPERLRREFRNAKNRPTNLDVRIDYVIAEVTKLFAPMKNLRSSHVHERRYDEPELRRLEFFEMLAEVKPDAFATHLSRVRQLARRNALGFVTDVNKGLASKLDRYFNYFSGLIFSSDGSIRIPSNLQ
jgi:hypothetical protein